MTRRHRDLSTRDDLIAWLRGLLPDPYAYPATSGSTYDEDVRRFEWVARPLWAVFSLLASGEYDEELVEPYVRRVKDGLDPEGPLAFPEPTLPRRQIIVEMEVFGYGLLVCPEGLLSRLTPAERDRLVTWLNLANGVDLPWGGWFCSRALVNVGLAAAGLPYDAERLALDLIRMICRRDKLLFTYRACIFQSFRKQDPRRLFVVPIFDILTVSPFRIADPSTFRRTILSLSSVKLFSALFTHHPASSFPQSP